MGIRPRLTEVPRVSKSVHTGGGLGRYFRRPIVNESAWGIYTYIRIDEDL